MKSPILFIIFKRPDTTQQVFERIREAQPPKLYIAADGPRPDKEGEEEQCQATRKIVENVDWPCEVHRLYREKNLGCGAGVSGAISWFFEHEEEGIIIEDDILPHIDFFRYCDEMLEKYREETKVKCICGHNKFFEGINYSYSYYFSHSLTIWGWATWRRTWKEYDRSLKTIPKNVFLKELKSLPIKKNNKQAVINIYDIMTSDHPIDTWDYQLLFSIWHHDGLNIIPINNLCKNIGIGHKDAVHTTSHNEAIESQNVVSCYPLLHPSKIKKSKALDIISFSRQFCAPNVGLFYSIKKMYYSIRAKLGLRTRLISIIQRVKKQ